MTQQEAAKIKLFKPEEAIKLLPVSDWKPQAWTDGLCEDANWMTDMIWVEEYVQSIDIEGDYALVKFKDGGTSLYYGKFQLVGETSPAEKYFKHLTELESKVEREIKQIREQVIRALKIHVHNDRNRFDIVAIKLTNDAKECDWPMAHYIVEHPDNELFIGIHRSKTITTKSLIDVLKAIEQYYKLT